MDECARGPACWARDSRCSAHQEHSRHEQVHGIEQTLRSSTAATAGRRSPAPPPAFVVATVDAPLPREAVARSRAPTGPRAQETAIGGRASERGQAGAAPRSCGRDNRRTFYKPRYSLLFNVILFHLGADQNLQQFCILCAAMFCTEPFSLPFAGEYSSGVFMNSCFNESSGLPEAP